MSLPTFTGSQSDSAGFVSRAHGRHVAADLGSLARMGPMDMHGMAGIGKVRHHPV